MPATPTTANRELSISRLINAPRELVWEAWTNPDHIKHWWGPEGFKNNISKMEVNPGGEWEFIMHGPDGTDYKNKHIYLELEKPSRIVMKHVSFPPFVMTATFEAKGRKTLVSLHSVFESAEQLAEVINVFKADVGMKQNIARMDAYITNLQLNSHPPFVIERTFNAPVDIVWQAISDKGQMKQWYFDLKEFKAEPGFEFSFAGTGTTGEQYIHLCKVLEAIPGKKLAYSWTYENREGYSVVSFELHPEGDNTRLTLTHAGIGSFAENGPDFLDESFIKGWTELIGTLLKNFLGKN